MEIVDGDVSTAEKITNENQNIPFSAPNVNILNEELLGRKKADNLCFTTRNNYKNYDWKPGEEHVQDGIRLVSASHLFSFVEAKIINWKKVGNNSYKRQSRRMKTGIINKAGEYCGLTPIGNFQNGWKIMNTRTNSDFTLFTNPFRAKEGAIFTRSELEYYGSYYSWNTLLK